MNRPDPAVILQGLAMFLDQDVRPAIHDKALSFRVRIAAHLARSLALQQHHEDAAVDAALERLARLVPHAMPDVRPTDREGRRALVVELDTALAAAIRTDRVADPSIAHAHVRASLAAELAVTNPRFDLSTDID